MTGGEPSATATRVSTEEGTDMSKEEAQAIAEQALLRLDDFPTGWTERPAEEEEDFQVDLPPECQSFIERETLPGTIVEVDSPEFHGPDDEEVDSGVTVFVNEDAAQDGFADVSDFLAECRQPFRDAFAEALNERLREDPPEGPFENVEVTEVNVDRLSFPPQGEQDMALQLSATISADGLSFDFYGDIIAMRVGRMVASLSFVSILQRPNSDEEERLADLIEERLSAAMTQLEEE